MLEILPFKFLDCESDKKSLIYLVPKCAWNVHLDLKKVLRMIFIDMDTLAPLGGIVGPLPLF